VRRRERVLPPFLVSPALRRCLFTVRAAISFARPALRLPRFCIDRLMCSYWRFRFGLFTPLGGIRTSCVVRASGKM
jgi:hypothetical protein